VKFLKEIASAYIPASQVVQVLNHPHEIELDGEIDLRPEQDIQDYSIEFDQVTLYIDDRPVLQNISFKIPSGESWGMVGMSGSGKSTCLALILRQLRPCSGIIRIGGVNVNDIPLAQLYRIVGVVSQKPVVFSKDVRSNISYGNNRLLSQDMMKIMRGVNMDLNCKSLSGGEQQRVNCLRVLLREPRILLLDEVTSALDYDCETNLMNIIHAECKKRKITCLCIAHRLHTIAKMDNILVLQSIRNSISKASILEQGTHEDLTNPFYANYKGWYHAIFKNASSERERDPDNNNPDA